MGSNADADERVEQWLARATGTDPEEVKRELEEGERRRVFVVDELIESGYEGSILLDWVMHLTGIEEREARALIRERTPQGP